MLLVLDFANLITEVVEPAVCEPAHQGAENPAEDSGGNEDGRVPFDPQVMCLCWTRG